MPALHPDYSGRLGSLRRREGLSQGGCWFQESVCHDNVCRIVLLKEIPDTDDVGRPLLSTHNLCRFLPLLPGSYNMDKIPYLFDAPPNVLNIGLNNLKTCISRRISNEFPIFTPDISV